MIILAVSIIAIWTLIELKRFKHKIFAMFLIGTILFFYLSAAVVFKDQDVNYKSIGGLTSAGKLYFSWLGSIFSNMKSISTQAVKMDWKSNEDLENFEKDK